LGLTHAVTLGGGGDAVGGDSSGVRSKAIFLLPKG